MNLKKTIVSAALVLATATCWAQLQDPGKKNDRPQPVGQQMQNRPQPPGFGDDFFPPEFIMHNRQALDLNDDQKKAIREIMKKSVADFTDLQWQQGEEQEAMGNMLKQEKVDEAKAVSQLEKLLGVENEIKKLQFTTMIKIKNLLNAEQQAKLREIKKSTPRMGEHRDMRGQDGGRPDGERGEAPPPPPPQMP